MTCCGKISNKLESLFFDPRNVRLRLCFPGGNAGDCNMSCRSVIVGPCKGFGSVKFTGNPLSMMYERSAALIVPK